MKFAVNASIMFIFQKEAGKRRKRNKPIISTTQICLLSFCFWVLRPPLPKRVHRRKGATEEDNLAMRWRKVVNKKENWNGRGGLSAAEVEYVEAIPGKDVWSAKPPLEDYIAGDSFAKKGEVNSNSRVECFLFYLPVSRRTKKTPKHEPQEKPLLRTLLAGMISKQALGF